MKETCLGDFRKSRRGGHPLRPRLRHSCTTTTFKLLQKIIHITMQDLSAETNILKNSSLSLHSMQRVDSYGFNS